MAEVLSQSQIDALLAAAQSGALDGGPQAEEAPENKYKKYDFYSPRKFSKDRLKILSSIYENYTRVINPVASCGAPCEMGQPDAHHSASCHTLQPRCERG